MTYQNCYKSSTKGLNFNVAESRSEHSNISVSSELDLINGHHISEYIPLYSGDILKESMILTKKKSTFAVFSSLNRKNKYNDNTVRKCKSKSSYLDMFYNKLGHPDQSKVIDSSRATLCEETHRTLENPDEIYLDSSEHAYDEIRRFYEDGSEDMKPFACSTCCFSTKSSTTIDTKLHSISEQDLTRRNQAVHSKIPLLRKNLVPSMLSLDNLGPDLTASKSKLDLLRKRQDYGRKVSEQNRIRIKEIKILKKLKK